MVQNMDMVDWMRVACQSNIEFNSQTGVNKGVDPFGTAYYTFATDHPSADGNFFGEDKKNLNEILKLSILTVCNADITHIQV